MASALILGVLKPDAVNRFAHDNEGSTVISYAFIAALVVVAGLVAASLAVAGSDRLLQELFYFITLD